MTELLSFNSSRFGKRVPASPYDSCARSDAACSRGQPKSPIDISDVSTRSSMDVMVFSSK
jgi:hypothetical protein